jgi:hypothetical protein
MGGPVDEFDGGRDRPANYISICDNLADSYPMGVPHGVQKDAVQNAVDAVTGKGPVHLEFALVENAKGRFFTMTDSGTTGLTGPVLEPKDYERDLPPDHHWARFESFAFTKNDPDAIGARGQGKFIFLRASKCYTMYYDTLRRDGVYRVGGTQAKKTGCPILPPAGQKWEGSRGAKELKDRCGLTPLSAIGSRVIIVDPQDDLVESLENGTFHGAIQETWFRAMEKKRLVVGIRRGRRPAEEVGLPQPYPLPRTDTREHKIWLLERDTAAKEVALTDGRLFGVKHFHAVCYATTDVPEEMRGIAVMQNGMKITSLQMEFAPPSLRDRLTGYIEFDRDLEQELRKRENQNPNHYDLWWRRSVPRAIKAYVQRQLDAFGKAKLGLGVDPREESNQRRSRAEEWAMRQLMKYAADLDLFGAKGKTPPGGGGDPPIPKLLGISINGFVFPDPEIMPRVNYGHQFDGFRVTAYNNTESAVKVTTSCKVMLGDTQVLDVVPRHEAVLDARQNSSVGPFSITVAEKVFAEPGEYRIVATLFNSATGNRIDRVSRRFWVEKDPDLRQPFDLKPADGLPPPNEHSQWFATGAINSSPTVYYNTKHPAYRIAEDNGDEPIADYMLNLTLEAAVDFILRRPDSAAGKTDFHPLDAESILGAQGSVTREDIPGRTYAEVVRMVSEVRWRMMEGA